MDPRRTSRVIDPKVRQVGFFTVGPRSDRFQNQLAPTGPSTSPPVISRSSNSLSPVMIPPPRHPSDATSRAVNVPAAVTMSTRQRRPSLDQDNNASNSEQLVVGCYNPDESVLGSSPPFSGIREGDGDADSEFSENSLNWIRRDDLGKFSAAAVPDGGFDSAAPAKREKESKKAHGRGSRKGR